MIQSINCKSGDARPGDFLDKLEINGIRICTIIIGWNNKIAFASYHFLLKIDIQIAPFIENGQRVDGDAFVNQAVTRNSHLLHITGAIG